MLAEKVLKKADRSGYAASAEWVDTTLGSPLEPSDEASVGRYLLAIVEAACRHGLDPEAALRQETVAARRRYEAAEAAERLDQRWITG
ncbi:MAG: hypothetical protein R2710_09145 [Acidimicrobiales bacterium]